MVVARGPLRFCAPRPGSFGLAISGAFFRRLTRCRYERIREHASSLGGTRLRGRVPALLSQVLQPPAALAHGRCNHNYLNCEIERKMSAICTESWRTDIKQQFSSHHPLINGELYRPLYNSLR